jgi:phosphatidate cytidylyltransferase
MSIKRVITALVLFPLLVLLLLKGSLSLLMVTILLTAFISCYEWAKLFDFPLSFLVAEEILLLTSLSIAFIYKIPLFYIFYLFLILSFLPFLLNYEKESFRTKFFPFFTGLLYLFIGFYPFWIILENYPRMYLIYFFSVVFGNDTGAYITGKIAGRHPFFPKISPKKTVEGFLGGLGLAVLVALIINKFFSLFPFKLNLVFAIALAIAGVVGDLFESAFKRMVNKKDSGRIIWGHGGMLDRIDGVLIASPLFLILLNLFK